MSSKNQVVSSLVKLLNIIPLPTDIIKMIIEYLLEEVSSPTMYGWKFSGKFHGQVVFNSSDGQMTQCINYELGLYHGKLANYYANTNIVTETDFVRHMKHGQHRVMLKNKITYLCNYSRGVLNGVENTYSNDGVLVKSCRYKDGELDGLCVDNRRMMCGYYHNGQKHGREQIFYDCGHIKKEYVYNKGSITETSVWASKCNKEEKGELHSHQLMKRCSVRNNTKHGKYEEYFLNGQVRFRLNYHYGYLCDHYEEWDKDGTKLVDAYL